MALTESNMMELGTKAPEFDLFDTVSSNKISLADLRSDKATVIIFRCNHFPYVLHINEELVRLSTEYLAKGVSFAAISSNDVDKYPQDAPDKMKALALEVGYPFPYLFDATQAVARAYDAACTPDFYVFDAQLQLRYRGRLCPSRPKSDTPVTGMDLRQAIDAILENSLVESRQYPSAGCNIKWKQ